jgi:uncharacterized coiled-coil protein SlyX
MNPVQAIVAAYARLAALETRTSAETETLRDMASVLAATDFHGQRAAAEATLAALPPPPEPPVDPMPE